MNDPSSWLPGSMESNRLQRTISDSNSVYFQQFINRQVQRLTNASPGVWTTLDHKPGSGDAAYINRRSAGATGGSWIADTGSAAEETGTPAQATFAYKVGITKGTVTGLAQAQGRTYSDLLMTELRGKSQDHVEKLLELAGVQGDTAASANQPSGLLTLINAQSGQVVAQGAATQGNALTESGLRQAIDSCRGTRKAIFCSRKGSRLIDALLAGRQSYNDMIEIRGGFRVRSYDDIPIVKTTQMPDDLVWSGTSVTAFSGGSTTAIAVVDLDSTWWEELQPVTAEMLAKTNSQQQSFEIYEYLTLVYANTLGGSLLAGITTTES